tara:strand:+ start:686 stop:889 length:204 start_codon:yes stop_codon:yes gene_type:complete
VVKEIEALKSMYKQVFATESGKKVLKDLEARCNFRNTTFIQNDSIGTAFEEGKRSVFLHILNMSEEE